MYRFFSATILQPLCIILLFSFVTGNEARSFFSKLYNLTDFGHEESTWTPFLRSVYGKHTSWISHTI
jgi:hypothetical protein